MTGPADAIAVVQARMGSSRVPGKAMLDLAGRPLIGHMIDRVRRVRHVGSIVLATSMDPRNDPMVEFARSEGLGVFRHPGEDDLAGRIAGAIRDLPGDIVLKVGGDCPFIDPAVLQRMVDAARADTGADFVSNRVVWSYPLGLSADVLSRRAIEWADANLVAPQDRELFAVWIRDHPEIFRVVPIVNAEKLDHLAWTVDEPADVEFARWVFSRLHRQGEVFGLAEMLAFLRAEGRL